MAAQKKTRKMSDEHKAALAEGRSQGRAVRLYLGALESNKPKRGRKRTAESVQKRLDRIASEIESAEPLKRLELTQEQLDLEDELAAGDSQWISPDSKSHSSRPPPATQLARASATRRFEQSA
jgi:hypothetical protein